MPHSPFRGGKDYANFTPDRVAMQDATARMALLQFMQAGRERVAVPTTVHCDHLILAGRGEAEDLHAAEQANHEVFAFLSSSLKKNGIGLWEPGAGIIHQLVPENYAFPDGMMPGTDSHTPNTGGLGMLAVGDGGADAVDVMAGLSRELLFPRLIGVRLRGELPVWATPKDVIPEIAGILSVKGGTGAVMEYFGEGTRTLSATGKASICNMGAEVGATSSLFGYDDRMAAYLKAGGRADTAAMADSIASCLRGDPEVYENPKKFFDRVIDINLTGLRPHLNGPFTPERVWHTEDMKEAVAKHLFPRKITYSLIGSCTNSSYEDISAAAGIIRKARARGLELKSKLMINPGSRRIKDTITRDGLLQIFEDAGATVLATCKRLRTVHRPMGPRECG